jgi:hypothetical protein
MCLRVLKFFLFATLIPCWVLIIAQEGSPQQETPTITIPDGTRVEVRFTRPLRAPDVRSGRAEDVESAKAGDKVRLVVAENVRINGKVVFARGAVGMATVVDSYYPVRNHNPNNKSLDVDSGLVLRLDWIKSVTDEKITVRSLQKGKPKEFRLMVLSAGKGYLARPNQPSHSLVRNMTGGLMYTREFLKAKEWLPAGTRMIAFVQGPVKLDQSEVEKMQSQFPPPDSRPLLTFYREKDRSTELASLSCDGKTVAQLARRQFVLLELDQGTHTCTVGDNGSLEVKAQPAEEYYIRIGPRLLSQGWDIKLVANGEGEDGMATAEMISQ